MNEEQFDFDSLAQLAQSDPQAFETKRQAMIADLIESAPEGLRERLRSFQWRVDMERQRCNNPLQACIRISNMMWDTIHADRGFLWALQALSDPGALLADGADNVPRAAVLAFKAPG